MTLKLATCCLLAFTASYAAVPRPHIEVVTTEQVDFAPGGTIRVEGSYGELNIEGWDEPRVEITVTRFTYPDHDKPNDRDAASRELNAIHITASKTGDRELAISTPHHKHWSGVRLDYRIRVPRSSSLVIHHGTGDVLIGGIEGNIDASAKVGDILLRLPREGTYSFDADCREGGIVSDFAGTYSRAHIIGEKFMESGPPTARRNHLHVGIGGIQIQQMGLSSPMPAL